MLTDLIKKVFTNKEVTDQPFPTVPPHTHNSVDSPALAPGAVDTVNIKPGAVGESKLLDLSVTEEKLAGAAVATAKIKDDAVTAAKVWKGGSVITLSAQIAEAIILTAHIQDLAVKWAKIGNLEVGNSKIMDAAISTGKIQDLAVTAAQIADATITNAKIGLLQVGNSRIMDLAVSTGKIQDLAVEWAKIGSLSVGNSKIMDAAISTAKIQTLAVTNAEVNDLNAGKVVAGTMAADRVWGGSGYFDYVQVRICGTEAVNVAGNISKSGTCNFSIPHPLKPNQRLIYTGIESAEILLVERGSSQLQNGQKRIDFSDHYRAVSDLRKVTAYLTPRDDCKGLILQEATNNHITVQEAGNGRSNARFDFIIFTVRQGFYDFDFEPEDLTLMQKDGETTEAFKQRYHDHRIMLIRKKGGPDIEQKVAEFEEGWVSTYGRRKQNAIQ